MTSQIMNIQAFHMPISKAGMKDIIRPYPYRSIVIIASPSFAVYTAKYAPELIQIHSAFYLVAGSAMVAAAGLLLTRGVLFAGSLKLFLKLL